MANTKKAEEKTTEEKKAERRFTKEQILSSSKYARRRDLLDAVLEDGKLYTVKEADTAITNFMKGKVSK
ncbi:MAG: hypothetical protein HDT30_11205 [Clostridiales bacterium]|nr:hypothetical protein [Clostridiales bacterium]